MIYKCEICGEEFNSQTECDEHEKLCGSTEHLLFVIQTLKGRIRHLESELELMRKSFPVYPCTPYSPNEWPPYNPYHNGVWCNANCNLPFSQKMQEDNGEK